MIVDDNVYIGKLATRGGWSFLLSRARRGKLARLLGRPAEDQRAPAQGENRRTLGR